MVIAGHNYSSHFGNLKNLSQDDTVIFTDVDGNRFHYRVIELETLAPDERGLGSDAVYLYDRRPFKSDRALLRGCRALNLREIKPTIDFACLPISPKENPHQLHPSREGRCGFSSAEKFYSGAQNSIHGAEFRVYYKSK